MFATLLHHARRLHRRLDPTRLFLPPPAMQQPALRQRHSLANLSHELFTPLTVMLGYANLLADDEAQHVAECARAIEEGGDRLLSTLTMLIDYASLDTEDAPATRKQEVPVSVWVREAVDGLAGRARRKGLSFYVYDAAPDAQALLNPHAFGKALSYVVDNAIKFTEEGTVQVTIGREHGQVVVRVDDTGIGMAPAFLPHAAEAFRQESSGMRRNFQGLGLGLTIAQHLVEAMGGVLTLTSRPGQGASVTMRFAACSPSAADEAVRVSTGWARGSATFRQA